MKFFLKKLELKYKWDIILNMKTVFENNGIFSKPMLTLHGSNFEVILRVEDKWCRQEEKFDRDFLSEDDVDRIRAYN